MFSAVMLFLACAGGTETSVPAATTQASPAPPAEPRTLTIAAYTTPREALGKAILPAFKEYWKEKAGEEVKFEESYQGSGAQARAVREGFEADVVLLSLDPDVALLEEAGLITHKWREAPHGGMITHSLAVIAVRPGNPKQIRDWSDLTRPDVEVLTPNVRTSGGAMWNVLSIWGAGQRGFAGVSKGDGAGAIRLLSGVLGRVKVMDKGARESMINFEKGVGDAAITYENEVLLAKMEGKAMDYVVPPSTVRIENPIAVVDTYAEKHGNQEIAKAFVEFCGQAPAQKAFSSYGFRPVDPAFEGQELPRAEDLFTVRDFGGWPAVKEALFADGAAYDQALQGGGKW